MVEHFYSRLRAAFLFTKKATGRNQRPDQGLTDRSMLILKTSLRRNVPMAFGTFFNV